MLKGRMEERRLRAKLGKVISPRVCPSPSGGFGRLGSGPRCNPRAVLLAPGGRAGGRGSRWLLSGLTVRAGRLCSPSPSFLGDLGWRELLRKTGVTERGEGPQGHARGGGSHTAPEPALMEESCWVFRACKLEAENHRYRTSGEPVLPRCAGPGSPPEVLGGDPGPGSLPSAPPAGRRELSSLLTTGAPRPPCALGGGTGREWHCGSAVASGALAGCAP